MFPYISTASTSPSSVSNNPFSWMAKDLSPSSQPGNYLLTRNQLNLLLWKREAKHDVCELGVSEQQQVFSKLDSICSKLFYSCAGMCPGSASVTCKSQMNIKQQHQARTQKNLSWESDKGFLNSEGHQRFLSDLPLWTGSLVSILKDQNGPVSESAAERRGLGGGLAAFRLLRQHYRDN